MLNEMKMLKVVVELPILSGLSHACDAFMIGKHQRIAILKESRNHGKPRQTSISIFMSQKKYAAKILKTFGMIYGKSKFCDKGGSPIGFELTCPCSSTKGKK